MYNPQIPECQENIELRRLCLLKLIDSLYHRLEAYREALEFKNKKFSDFKATMFEEVAAEVWTGLQLYDLAARHDLEAADRIVLDRSVNKTDPDFSFKKALKDMRAQWDASP